MRAPTPTALLDAWERGGEGSVAMRGLLLLDTADTGLDRDALARLAIGRRDGLLLRLRQRLFGDVMEAVVACPACAARVELSLSCDGLLALDAGDGVGQVAIDFPRDGKLLTVQLPATVDLLAIEACATPAEGRELLLRRCTGTGTWTNGDATRLEAAMAAADPLADIELACQCPECSHDFTPGFDVARFLWSEVHAWALRFLRQVDLLARTYHWREADILALSPVRRQAYLELCVS
jgi:hypothetical protein